MPEKTVNASQKIILLRLRFVSIAMCLALLLCSFVLPASAAGFDYNDYVTNIRVDGDNDIVTVVFPASSQLVSVAGVANGYGSLSVSVNEGVSYNLSLEPFPGIMDLSNIPDGTTYTYNFDLDVSRGYETPYLRCFNSFLEDFSYVVDVPTEIGTHHYEGVISISGSIQRPNSSVDGLNISLWAYDLKPISSGTMTIRAYDFVMTMKISSLYRLQQQSGKTNEILKEVEKKLEEQGKTLDDVLKEQQQTNDKLDELPGQIGDEMQGVIDKEKDEATSSGNKYVDQILSALPDPSTDVLAAMKRLTDATAYTGTDATLPIPAIVLPAVEGLFPETVIWGGTEFDFGDSIAMLPSSLLTLVQSLFTIAIVLYCVYELKGIVSYCLTLRESKGG